MPLSTVGIAPGLAPIAAEHILQIIRLLTGEMVDQPVTLKQELVVGGNQAPSVVPLKLMGVELQDANFFELWRYSDVDPCFFIDKDGHITFAIPFKMTQGTVPDPPGNGYTLLYAVDSGEVGAIGDLADGDLFVQINRAQVLANKTIDDDVNTIHVKHATLEAIGADDHHDKLHHHDGEDGSGTVSHTDLTDMTTDDHHPMVHVHDGTGPGGGALSHTVLTDVTADQHHAESHLHDGEDGTPKIDHALLTNINTDGGLTEIHHTLGTTQYQAAKGSHTHDGGAGGAKINHDVLDNVTADQHHPKAHMHNVTDGTPQLDHSTLGNLAVGNPHPQYAPLGVGGVVPPVYLPPAVGSTPYPTLPTGQVTALPGQVVKTAPDGSTYVGWLDYNLNVPFIGNGGPVTVGLSAYIKIDDNFQIVEWDLLADRSTNCQIDVLLCTFATFSEGFATICNDGVSPQLPELVDMDKAQMPIESLTHWTEQNKPDFPETETPTYTPTKGFIPAGSIIQVSVLSNDSAQLITFSLKIRRTD